MYATILGVEAPWIVVEVQVELSKKQVEVFLEYGEPRAACPECGSSSAKYDTKERRFRHLDTCQLQTILVARVPRVSCDQHGVRQVKIPWAEGSSRFTVLMEAVIIDWLKAAPISSVAEQMGLSWDEVDGVLQRAVKRGLAKRELRLPSSLTVDEKSFQKGHEFVTIVGDRVEGIVLHVGDGRTQAELSGFLSQFPQEELAGLDSISMDMWQPYIQAVHEVVPEAEEKIAFDRFHLAQHMSKAIDQVRRQETKALAANDDDRLKKTRHLWLRNPENLREDARIQLDQLRKGTLKTARAWALKEAMADLWHYSDYQRAEAGWLRWHAWAIRSRLEPVKRIARMVKRHLPGILNAVVSGITNGKAEGMNSVIQWLKYRARGFRNRERFKAAIYFHLGGLDLYPGALKRSAVTHTNV